MRSGICWQYWYSRHFLILMIDWCYYFVCLCNNSWVSVMIIEYIRFKRKIAKWLFEYYRIIGYKLWLMCFSLAFNRLFTILTKDKESYCQARVSLYLGRQRILKQIINIVVNSGSRYNENRKKNKKCKKNATSLNNVKKRK